MAFDDRLKRLIAFGGRQGGKKSRFRKILVAVAVVTGLMAIAAASLCYQVFMPYLSEQAERERLE